MVSWEDPEVDTTLYFTLSATIIFPLFPFCLVQVMFGGGIPLALQAKFAEEPSLAGTSLGGITVELEESKIRGSENKFLELNRVQN